MSTVSTTIINRAAAWIADVRHDEKGQGLAEYALIFVFVTVVAVTVIVFFGPAISSDLHQIGASL